MIEAGIHDGDYVFVRRQFTGEKSFRFQSKNFDSIFQVVEVHGSGDLAKTYTLSDLSGRRSGLGFTQPVAAERLTPVELLPLAREDDDSLTSMIYNDGGRDRPAKVKAQSLDGKVYIEFDDEPGKEVCVDLSKSKYRWC